MNKFSHFAQTLVVCDKNRKILRKKTNIQVRTSWTSIPWTSAISITIRHGFCTDCQQRILAAFRFFPCIFLSLLCLPYAFFFRREPVFVSLIINFFSTINKLVFQGLISLRMISNFLWKSLLLRNVPVSLGIGENAIGQNVYGYFNCVCWKDYLSSGVFTAMHSIHIRMNRSLTPTTF